MSCVLAEEIILRAEADALAETSAGLGLFSPCCFVDDPLQMECVDQTYAAVSANKALSFGSIALKARPR